MDKIISNINTFNNNILYIGENNNEDKYILLDGYPLDDGYLEYELFILELTKDF
jgi:hypothetical protein